MQANSGDSRRMAVKNDMKTSEAISKADYKDKVYPFENLVFEGGGAKGAAYIGCLKVLEEVGVKPRRVAGTSAGAIVAMLVAVGYRCDEIEEIMKVDLEDLLIDHSYGGLSFIPNILRGFGWNRAEKFVDFIGKLLVQKHGNADLTFKELFNLTNVELCLVAVKLNMETVTYFHPKTTPNFPIRKALRMSVSIPGLFEPVIEENATGAKDYYIDGGLLCNYPIHVFDGWWLSMAHDDAFLKRLQPLSQLHSFRDKAARFNEYNSKTLGFVVYSASENDYMRAELEKRVGFKMSERPKDSKLYKSRAGQQKSSNHVVHSSQQFIDSADKFMNALKLTKAGRDTEVYDVITLKDLRELLSLAKGNSTGMNNTPKQDILMQSDIEILFGGKLTAEEMLEKLDYDKKGEITYDELLRYMTRSGLDVEAQFQGYERTSIDGVKDYTLAIEGCLMTNTQKVFLQARDIGRTVGINTDYVETTDFKLEQSDREFLKQQGMNATIAFLKQHAAAQT